MAGDPSNLLPFRWQPGQSGNPAGSSARARQARRLRSALDLLLAEAAPPWLIHELQELDDLPGDVLEELPPDTTIAEVIALRLTLVASLSPEPRRVLDAAALILRSTAKGDPLEPVDPVARVPELPTTDERRRAMARQLGLEVDDGDDAE